MVQIGIFIFDRRQPLLVSKFRKMCLLTVNTIWISSLNVSHAFNRSDVNSFVPIIRFDNVVYSLKALFGSLGHYKDLNG